MELNIDNDDVVEAIRDDAQLVDEIADALTDKMEAAIREQVREAFDYHHDHFRMSWMRMMEAELGDLTASSRDGEDGGPIACNHGQQMYDGIFHAIRQYVGGEGNNAMKEMLGIGDDLVATLTELINAAVETAVSARINSVWQGSGYTIDARPQFKIGAPQPAFKPVFVEGDVVLCNAANEPHKWNAECTNPRRAEDEFGNPLVTVQADE